MWCGLVCFSSYVFCFFFFGFNIWWWFIWSLYVLDFYINKYDEFWIVYRRVIIEMLRLVVFDLMYYNVYVEDVIVYNWRVGGIGFIGYFRSVRCFVCNMMREWYCLSLIVFVDNLICCWFMDNYGGVFVLFFVCWIMFVFWLLLLMSC